MEAYSDWFATTWQDNVWFQHVSVSVLSLALVNCVVLAVRVSFAVRQYDSRRPLRQVVERLFQPVEFQAPCLSAVKRTIANRHSGVYDHEATATQSFRKRVGKALSMDHTFGRVMEMLQILFTLATLVTYVRDTQRPVVRTLDGASAFEPSLLVDLIANSFFFLYWTVEFLSKEDKLQQAWHPLMIVDLFTVPPFFYAYISGDFWLGFRFLRFARLLRIVEFFSIWGLLRTNTRLAITRIVFHFLTGVFCAAGFMHLVENMAVQKEDPHGVPWTYFDAVYFIVVTISSVGYGDITSKTIIGQVSVLVIIVGGFSLFATATPVLVEALSSRNQYLRRFRPYRGKPHVVLSGSCSENVLRTFVREFFHPDRGNLALSAVVLHTEKPSDAMVLLLKRTYRLLTYVMGSAMRAEDLARANASTALACIILSDHKRPDRAQMDEENILRAISIKNMSKSVPCILQVSSVQAQEKVHAIPGWDRSIDTIVCIDEVRYGALAQSVLAPGSCTLLMNLVGTCAARQHDPHRTLLDQLYETGRDNEFYIADLPESLWNASFRRAAAFCYREFGVILLGIDMKTASDAETDRRLGWKLLLNPGEGRRKIAPGSRGVFIARNRYAATHVTRYRAMPGGGTPGLPRRSTVGNATPRKSAHGGASGVELVPFDTRRASTVHQREGSSSDVASPLPPSTMAKFVHSRRPLWEFPLSARGLVTKARGLDPAGKVFSGPARSFEEAQKVQPQLLFGHVVVCVPRASIGTDGSLSFLLRPLRGSFLPRDQLRKIVLLGSERTLRQHWDSVNTLPDVYVVVGDPGKFVDLIERCNVMSASSLLVLMGQREIAADPYLVDREGILATLLVQSWAKKSGGHLRVHLVTEIHEDSNVVFLDHDDEDNPERGIEFSDVYASGRVFVSSALSALLCHAFFDPVIVEVVKELMGSGTQELTAFEAHERALRDDHKSAAERDDADEQGRASGRLLYLHLSDTKWQFLVGVSIERAFFALLDRGIVLVGVHAAPPGGDALAGGAPALDSFKVVAHPDPAYHCTIGDRLYALGNYSHLYSAQERA